jgi:hypothetical protein
MRMDKYGVGASCPRLDNVQSIGRVDSNNLRRRQWVLFFTRLGRIFNGVWTTPVA